MSAHDEGEILTPHGVVCVYAQGGQANDALTRLDFVHTNHLHIRTFRKRYSHRGIVTKAREFAEEIAGENS